jgi:hypothetical protein
LYATRQLSVAINNTGAELETLHLSSGFYNEDVQPLTNLTKLTSLSGYWCYEDTSVVCSFTHLRELDLSDMGWAKGLKLDQWPQTFVHLTWLDLCNTPLLRENLTALCKLPQLKELDCSCCDVSSEDLHQAVKLPFTSLGIKIERNGIPDVLAFFKAGGGKQLQCLDLDMEHEFEQLARDEVDSVMDCLQPIRTLVRLDLYHGFDMLANIGLLTGLVHLTAVRSWAVSGTDGLEDVSKLTTLTCLQEVSLDESEFPGLGAKVVEILSSSLTNLKHVSYASSPC